MISIFFFKFKNFYYFFHKHRNKKISLLTKQSTEIDMSPSSAQSRLKKYVDRITSYYQLESKFSISDVEKLFKQKDHEQKLLNQMV